MPEIYWELDSFVDNIARAHLYLISQRSVCNSGEFYGPLQDPWCQFVLTYNVIESIHSLGFPLDSPRLKRALSWMKANVESIEMLGESETVLGKLFLLKSFQYMPGFKDKFKNHIDTLPAFIQKNINNQDAEMLPFMVLDSFIESDLRYEDIIKMAFEKIECDLKSEFLDIGKLSYAFFLSYKYLNLDCEYEVIKNVNKLSAESLLVTLNKTTNFSAIFNEACYCLLNMGRIDNSVLSAFKLDNHFYILREWAIKYLAQNTNKICYNKNRFELVHSNLQNTLPKEIAKSNIKYINIYKICIIVRAISESSLDPKQLKIAVAHNQLKIIYEKCYDPIYLRYKILRFLFMFLLMFTVLFAFDFIKVPNIDIFYGLINSTLEVCNDSTRDKLFHWAGGITAILAIYNLSIKRIKNSFLGRIYDSVRLLISNTQR